MIKLLNSHCSYLEISISPKFSANKGHLISKCLFVDFNYSDLPNNHAANFIIMIGIKCAGQSTSKKWTKTRRIVVKTNSFVRFLEDFTAWQFAFEVIWPLATVWNCELSITEGSTFVIVKIFLANNRQNQSCQASPLASFTE